jgi:alanine racemase
LQKSGCLFYYTAYLDEAIALRSKLGAMATIFVLHGFFPKCEEEFVKYNLVPVIHDIGQLERWQAYAAAKNKHLVTAIQIDTGMSRCAIPYHDIHRLVDQPELTRNLNISLIMSHLACADEPRSPFNRQQLDKFAALKSILPHAPASLASSGGIFLGDEFHFNMVRPGRALLGLNPVPGDNPMNTVVYMWARICQVQQVKPGQTIGYSRTYKVKKPMKIATLTMGYADGYAWSLGNKGYVKIAGYKANVVGRISMDLLTVDVTHIPEQILQNNEWAMIIGNDPNVDKISGDAQTLSRETTLRFGSRLHKIYL